MMLTDRVDVYNRAYAKWPASHLRIMEEQGQPVIYGTWQIGNDYRNRSKYYGAYPPGYLERVAAVFPDVGLDDTLHVFAGSVPSGAWRMDCSTTYDPEIVGSVYEARELINRYIGRAKTFGLIVADPPYTTEDAKQYGTKMVNRGKALGALWTIAQPGGHLVWLDTVWPMHRKTQWRTCGRICLIRSTNHRVRLVSIFERVGEGECVS